MGWVSIDDGTILNGRFLIKSDTDDVPETASQSGRPRGSHQRSHIWTGSDCNSRQAGKARGVPTRRMSGEAPSRGSADGVGKVWGGRGGWSRGPEASCRRSGGREVSLMSDHGRNRNGTAPRFKLYKRGGYPWAFVFRESWGKDGVGDPAGDDAHAGVIPLGGKVGRAWGRRGRGYREVVDVG